MSKTHSAAAIFLILFIVAVSCSSEKKRHMNDDNSFQIYNPNGDSELALLMRDMFEEAKRLKEQVANGETLTLKLDHQKILTAHATEPDKAASEEYKAFAQTYLQVVEQIKNSDKENASLAYENLVKNCTSCHEALCPGPLVRIKKL